MNKDIYISVLKNEISRLLEENLLLNTLLLQKEQEKKDIEQEQE